MILSSFVTPSTRRAIFSPNSAFISSKPTSVSSGNAWDSTQYQGRRLIGVYATMEEAIDAANEGYKMVRAMSVAQREKVITT